MVRSAITTVEGLRSCQSKTQQNELQRLEHDSAALEFYLSLTSPWYFGHSYCGDTLFCESPEFHKDICKVFENLDGHTLHAEADPRGHGKSTWWSKIGPLWATCARKKRFIVLISSSATIAESNLAWIRKQLEFNRALQRDFGNLVGREKWTQSDIVTSTGVQISARGAGANLRGLISNDNIRPDLIIIDDAEDNENVNTLEQRKKLQAWIDKIIMGLPGPGGADVLLVGTILHYDSLLSKQIKKWKGLLRKAIVSQEDKRVLAPSLWPYEELVLKRDGDGEKEGIGTIAFEQEYQNNPIDEEGQRIKQEWIDEHAYEDHEIEDLEFVISIALDPAVGKSATKGDFAGIVAIGRAPDNRLYVLDCELKRIRAKVQVESLFLKYGYYNSWRNTEDKTLSQVIAVAIEANGFQDVLKDMIAERSQKDQIYMPIIGINNIKDKAARIDTLSPLIEQGILRLRKKGQRELKDQMVQFPKAAHDDGPDATEMAVRVLRKSYVWGAA